MKVATCRVRWLGATVMMYDYCIIADTSSEEDAYEEDIAATCIHVVKRKCLALQREEFYKVL